MTRTRSNPGVGPNPSRRSDLLDLADADEIDIEAASWLASEREGRDLMRKASPLVVAYALLCVAFNGVILYASPDMTGLLR